MRKLKMKDHFLCLRGQKMGRPYPNFTYRIHNPVGIKLLTRLHLGPSHLNDHKFRHNTADCVNPLCSCSIKPETTRYFFSVLPQFFKYQKKII